MDYFAHSGTAGDKSDWQRLRDHLRAVAKLAAAFANPFGLEKAAAVLGLFHDLGKYDPSFQRRLEGADIRVDHSTAGARILMDLSSEATRQGAARPEDAFMAELLAYCVLGHHAGLPDKDTSEAACFLRRIDGFQDRIDPSWKREIGFDLVGLMPEQVMRKVAGRGQQGFDLSVVTRMLFSCLVDADFKDTEAHYARLKGLQPDRRWPSLPNMLPDLVKRFDAHMANFDGDGYLNRLRADVLAHVRGNAALAPGLFTLNVPTGGGKTLASLGFALDHARQHGHRRIIYAIPFTSIIDQTAEIFRDVLGSENVLEHHSAIDEDEQAAHRDGRTRPTSRDRMKLAMEDWGAPVVVTTNVQFFESLFAARTSRARKLHNIANSVIVLDEAQTIPRRLLKPSVRMLDTLAHLFGCTIVLCTATQPALGKIGWNGQKGFEGGLDLPPERELAPDPEKLAARLRRTRINHAGYMDNAALVDALMQERQALVIVNSRRHALELYKAAQAGGVDGLVHLTTRQCAAHRCVILAEVRARLNRGQPCRVIATSLIEAGVDVDFPKVWRAEAGLDSIVQAAGRCNREGRRPLDDSIVTVFRSRDYPPPKEIQGLVADMARVTSNHDDLLSLAAIQDYFGEVYWRANALLDAKKIVPAFKVKQSGTDFAFRQVARDFRMIESAMEPVIVAWEEKADRALDELQVEQISSGRIARQLQRYIVQVPPRARARLIQCGHVAFKNARLRGDQFAVLLPSSRGLYSEVLGLLWEDAEYLTAENSMI